ncbi:MAG: SAM-dependent chlorinase/fluorinase [Bacteroidales bacterium]|nr:SAM-dependent chlorinase/fluorinase [Bacteroidales bacterium]
MAIITLTTDWGLKDFYVGAFKGLIISKCPGAIIVDISNEIPSFDILKASFVLKNSYGNFPKGTIHVVDINKWHERNKDFSFIAVLKNGSYFIGRDNGLFSLAFESLPETIVQIHADIEEDQYSLNIRDLYVKVISHIFRGKPLEELGNKKNNWFEMKNLQPLIDENVLIGSIIYVDSYGNAITNIARNLFNEVGKGRQYKIIFKREGYYDINKISKNYHDIETGDRLALFNSSDYLEIAINEGNASSLIDLKYNETIRIEFY